MQYFLYHIVSHGDEVKETFDSIETLVARAKTLETEFGNKLTTLYAGDENGDEIYTDGSGYVYRRAPDPVAEAIDDDKADKERRVYIEGLGRPKLTYEEKQKLNEEYGFLTKPFPSPDSNVEAVREKLLQRSVFGLNKYGVTTERKDVDMLGWLTHLQEELLDGAVYVQRIKAQIESEKGRLRARIEHAYEAGYEQCAQDGAADYPQNPHHLYEYVDSLLYAKADEK